MHEVTKGDDDVGLGDRVDDVRAQEGEEELEVILTDDLADRHVLAEGEDGYALEDAVVLLLFGECVRICIIYGRIYPIHAWICVIC